MGSLVDLKQVAVTIVSFQLAMPLLVAGVGIVGGWTDTPVFLSLLIMAAAPSISGSPNMCLMMRYPAEYAMRLVVAGTALLPITALPIFWLMPELGDMQAVLMTTLRLFLTIVVAILSAVVLRRTVLREPSNATLLNMEGAATITLAVFVVGLMPSLSAVAIVNPGVAIFWIVFACVINFGAQVVSFRLTRASLPPAKATAVSLIAGNRNIAIFFVALPPELTLPIMVFIGAYQIPMYLTPLIMGRLYRQADSVA
ncbi:hypothetical protein [Ruegeria conchae]|uniref:hypothetical protein n=1 Tax=Ruegeria conchae TaxID=981384 RepID=UPI0021A3F7A9|nr:hypothetical protein [Ruegeria conchae]